MPPSPGSAGGRVDHGSVDPDCPVDDRSEASSRHLMRWTPALRGWTNGWPHSELPHSLVACLVRTTTTLDLRASMNTGPEAGTNTTSREGRGVFFADVRLLDLSVQALLLVELAQHVLRPESWRSGRSPWR